MKSNMKCRRKQPRFLDKVAENGQANVKNLEAKADTQKFYAAKRRYGLENTGTATAQRRLLMKMKSSDSTSVTLVIGITRL